MSSSISSSDPAAWSRFLRRLLATTAGLCLAIYVFIVLVDPWGVLPLSIPAERPPISTNARYAFPGLARSARFDSAIVGSSTARVFLPDALNAALGTRFVNLGMNAASPYEQTRILEVFLRAHPRAAVVIQGLDLVWCSPGEPPRYSPRPFPEPFYEASPWPAYREMLSVYALNEAVAQFAVLTGIRRARYGRDGYTRYLPLESLYDPARALAQLRPITWDSAAPPAAPASPIRFQGAEFVQASLRAMAPETRAILAFMPLNLGTQPDPATPGGAILGDCKRQIADVARQRPNTILLDFMRASAITREASHYWDEKHFRDAIRDRITAILVEAARGIPGPSPDFAVLAP